MNTKQVEQAQEPRTVQVSVTAREWDTMLAALRTWQNWKESTAEVDCETVVEPMVREIANEHGKQLDDSEIDKLIKRIQFAPKPEKPVIVVSGGNVQDVFAVGTGEDYAFELIDYDNLDQDSPEDRLATWNGFSSALQEHFKKHCQPEYQKYFKDAIDEACTCADESWYGQEHSTACPVTGSNDASLLTPWPTKKRKKAKKPEAGRIQLPKGSTINERAKRR